MIDYTAYIFAGWGAAALSWGVAVVFTSAYYGFRRLTQA